MESKWWDLFKLLTVAGMSKTGEGVITLKSTVFLRPSVWRKVEPAHTKMEGTLTPPCPLPRLGIGDAGERLLASFIQTMNSESWTRPAGVPPVPLKCPMVQVLLIINTGAKVRRCRHHIVLPFPWRNRGHVLNCLPTRGGMGKGAKTGPVPGRSQNTRGWPAHLSEQCYQGMNRIVGEASPYQPGATNTYLWYPGAVATV